MMKRLGRPLNRIEKFKLAAGKRTVTPNNAAVVEYSMSSSSRFS